ncbi:MAG: AAA family ATPase, partial [Phycisphaerae bacterium]|nr:AAA family ATPase [Phycisphaerae bacterium]
MIVKEIHIDGFGIFSNRTYPDLSPGINIFLGKNETGKTTLLNFVRAILFGSNKSTSGRYLPINSSKHGGYITLLRKDGEYNIERFFGANKDKSFTLILPDGSGGGESNLSEIFQSVTSELYFKVFAFGLGDYALEEQKIFERIKSASTGTGKISPYDVQKDFERLASEIYTRRAKTKEVNKLVEKWNENKRKLNEYKKKLPEYDELNNRKETAKEKLA